MRDVALRSPLVLKEMEGLGQDVQRELILGQKAPKSSCKVTKSWGTWDATGVHPTPSAVHTVRAEAPLQNVIFSSNSQRLGRFSGYHRWIERKKVGRVLIIFQSSKTLKHMPKVKLFFLLRFRQKCKRNNLLYFTFWQTLMLNPERGGWLNSMI